MYVRRNLNFETSLYLLWATSGVVHSYYIKNSISIRTVGDEIVRGQNRTSKYGSVYAS